MREHDADSGAGPDASRPPRAGGAEAASEKSARRTPPSLRRAPGPSSPKRAPAPSDAFRLLFRQNPLPVWVFDRETRRILDANDAALRTYGYSREEFLGLTVEELHPRAEPPARAEGRRTARIAGPHRTRDGRLIEVEIASQPLDFAGRKAVAVFAVGPVRAPRAPGSDGVETPRPRGAPAVPARERAASPAGERDLRSSAAIAAHLKERLLGDLYAGRLQPGDRLPSIREVADELGATNWSVSDAYRLLAREGLVERRARSGVFVATLERRWGAPASETAEWLADVLTQASDHLIRVPIFPELVRRYTAAVQLRCACVESDQDSLTALCTESAMQFGLDSYPVHASALAPPRPGGERLPPEIREADLLLTTAFHAPALHAVAEALGKPLVVATLDPDTVLAIREHLEREGELTAICADPAFAVRLRALLEASAGDRVRIVLARDADAVARLGPTEALLLTRAAAQQLEGMSLRLLVPRFPSFSRQSARALAEALIRLNLRSVRS